MGKSEPPIVEWTGWTHAWFAAAELQARRIREGSLDGRELEFLLYSDALRNVLRGAERVLAKGHEAVRSEAQCQMRSRSGTCWSTSTTTSKAGVTCS